VAESPSTSIKRAVVIEVILNEGTDNVAR
jgi:hypothetical protein